MAGVPNYPNVSFPFQSAPDLGDWNILARGSGLTGVTGGCAVTAQAVPDMTVHVAAGSVAVAGTVAAVVAANPAIGAADATNPRIDLVVVSAAGAVSVTAGVAAAVPELPAVPSTSVTIAMVYVPAAVVAITTAMLVDKRVTVVPFGTTAGTIQEANLAILKALLTAKGSFIVATAAGAPADFPAGTDGRLIRALTSAASGAEWVDPYNFGCLPIPMASGYYYNANLNTQNVLVQSRMYLVPITFGVSCTLVRVGIGIAFGGVSRVVRLGLYEDTAGLPAGAALYDWGTVSAAAAGSPEITISSAVKAGKMYWYAIVAQVGAATVHGDATFGNFGMMGNPTLATLVGAGGTGARTHCLYDSGSVTGALPTIGTLTAETALSPTAAFRA